MKLRLAVLSMLAVVVSLLGFTGPASAVTWISDQNLCNSRSDFAAFIRHGDPADKYCYNNAGPTPIWLGLDGVTWFSSGNNSGWFEFWDGGTQTVKTFPFGKWVSTGCTNCTIRYFHLDK